MRWCAVTMACGGCALGGSPTSIDSLAGCQVVVDWTENGVPDSQVTMTWNGDGDLVETRESLDGVPMSRATLAYGAPHQVSEEVLEFADRSGIFGRPWRTFSFWQDGRIVEIHVDDDDDGEIDFSDTTTYDADGLVSWRGWDYRADGVIEREADYAWTPDGAGGWDGTSEGFDGIGVLWTTEHADAEARIDRYQLLDDRGLEEQWSWAGRSPKGFEAHTESGTSYSGVLWQETVVDRVLDADGLPVSETRWSTQQTGFAYQSSASKYVDTERVGLYGWICP